MSVNKREQKVYKGAKESFCKLFASNSRSFNKKLKNFNNTQHLDKNIIKKLMSKNGITCVTLILAFYTIPLANIAFIYGIQNKNDIICNKKVGEIYVYNTPVIDIFIWFIVNSCIMMFQLFFDPLLLFTIYCIKLYPFILALCFCSGIFQLVWLIFGSIIYCLECQIIKPDIIEYVLKIMLICGWIGFVLRILIICCFTNKLNYDDLYQQNNEYTKFDTAGNNTQNINEV